MMTHIALVVALLATSATSLLEPPPATWTWPVNHTPSVVRDFDAPESPWGPGHRGLDLAASVGASVRAPVSGTISFSGEVATRGVITIRTHEGHLVSMEPVVGMVTEGRVRAGEKIGSLAAGHCAGGCLHMGLRVNGEYRSPARELGILRRAILVP
jgi:murein DD-endopeptidase MepM/ murein hydrolase activator NlpD